MVGGRDAEKIVVPSLPPAGGYETWRFQVMAAVLPLWPLLCLAVPSASPLSLWFCVAMMGPSISRVVNPYLAGQGLGGAPKDHRLSKTTTPNNGC